MEKQLGFAKSKKRMQKARKRTGLSQHKFALIVGIDVTTLRNIEQGLSRGSDDTWGKVERVLQNMKVGA